MNNRPHRQRFTLVVQDAGQAQAPLVHRLRSFLKMALRSYRIRCVSIQELLPEGADDTDTQEVRR